MEDQIIRIPFKVTGEFVDGVMCTALEGGITYWARQAKVVNGDYKGGEYGHEVVSREGALEIILIEPHDEKNTKSYMLDLEGFVRGYGKYVKWCVSKGRVFYTKSEDMDAIEADLVIQFALFGEVVYG